MVNRQMRHRFRLAEPNVDRDAASPLFVGVNTPPTGYAAADGTKMKLDRLPPLVVLGATRDVDALAFEVIDPQNAVPTTDGAIACRGRLGHAFEAPSHRTTMTRAFDHRRYQANALTMT